MGLYCCFYEERFLSCSLQVLHYTATILACALPDYDRLVNVVNADSHMKEVLSSAQRHSIDARSKIVQECRLSKTCSVLRVRRS